MTAVVDLQQAIHGVKGRHYFFGFWVEYLFLAFYFIFYLLFFSHLSVLS